MKLQKFIKNKKQKQILIGTIIGLIILIGGITLYRTFAMYKEEKTFDVLQGKVPDFSGIYKEDLLNGADPVLDEEGELVPVIINEENGTVKKAGLNDQWYKYEDKQWANAVILTESGKSKDYQDGTTIEENDIESYFVWIPKYKYKIQTLETSTTPQAFEIEFDLTDTEDTTESCKTPNKSKESGACQVDYWMTHPAFTAFPGSKGMWVGKFETSNTSSIQIKYGKTPWRTYSSTEYNYNRTLDSHMMKNTEWGAVAYLSYSKYGTCDNNNTCENVTANSNTSLITGYASTNIAYPKSQDASTTKNLTGIFDMSGGSWEYVMGFMFDSTNTKPLYANGLGESNFPTEEKYYDKYVYSSSATDFTRRILGDATAETRAWYGNTAGFVYPNHAEFSRGAAASHGTPSIFAFGPDHVGWGYATVRIILTPIN